MTKNTSGLVAERRAAIEAREKAAAEARLKETNDRQATAAAIRQRIRDDAAAKAAERDQRQAGAKARREQMGARTDGEEQNYENDTFEPYEEEQNYENDAFETYEEELKSKQDAEIEEVLDLEVAEPASSRSAPTHYENDAFETYEEELKSKQDAEIEEILDLEVEEPASLRSALTSLAGAPSLTKTTSSEARQEVGATLDQILERADELDQTQQQTQQKNVSPKQEVRVEDVEETEKTANTKPTNTIDPETANSLDKAFNESVKIDPNRAAIFKQVQQVFADDAKTGEEKQTGLAAILQSPEAVELAGKDTSLRVFSQIAGDVMKSGESNQDKTEFLGKLVKNFEFLGDEKVDPNNKDLEALNFGKAHEATVGDEKFGGIVSARFQEALKSVTAVLGADVKAQQKIDSSANQVEAKETKDNKSPNQADQIQKALEEQNEATKLKADQDQTAQADKKKKAEKQAKSLLEDLTITDVAKAGLTVGAIVACSILCPPLVIVAMGAAMAMYSMNGKQKEGAVEHNTGEFVEQAEAELRQEQEGLRRQQQRLNRVERDLNHREQNLTKAEQQFSSQDQEEVEEPAQTKVQPAEVQLAVQNVAPEQNVQTNVKPEVSEISAAVSSVAQAVSHNQAKSEDVPVAESDQTKGKEPSAKLPEVREEGAVGVAEDVDSIVKKMAKDVRKEEGATGNDIAVDPEKAKARQQGNIAAG